MGSKALFLAGEFVETSRVKPVLNPYDRSLVSEICFGAPEHLELAIEAAHERLRKNSNWLAHLRAEVLERARAGIESRLDDFADAIVKEAGKPRGLAIGEVKRCLDTFTDAAYAARSPLDSVEPLEALASGAGRVGLVKRVPVGPVAGISPFNFPLNLVAHKVTAAIAAGCPMVLKPASQTPSPALLLAAVLQEAGLPPGMLSVLPLNHQDASPLAEDPRIKLLSFTGSPEVGWRLKTQAQHMRVLLELGGNAGNIVCSDADLDLAVSRLAMGGFAYAGQSCISVQRIYVHSSVYAAFVDSLVAYTSAQVGFGDPEGEGVITGPLISAGDADRVERWIRDACDSGAERALGGGREGNVVEPTILLNTGDSEDVMAKEVFGPVVNVLPYDELDEAISRVNESQFGLQAAIFTQDISNVMKAHAEFEVGGVVHNDASAFRVDLMPYGGVKNSGLGREGPRHAIYEYTEPRILILRK